MQGNSYKYYASYDTNIKGTGGSGTITQRTPPDRESLSDYLRQPFYPGTRVIPPTQPIMYDNKPNDTNAYLNPNNFIEQTNNDFYFQVSQQMDTPTIFKQALDKRQINKLTKENAIQIPPPLITTKPNKISEQQELEDNKKDKKEKKDKKNKKDKKDKKEKKEDKQEIKKKALTDYLKKQNSWYDGKYLYVYNSYEPDDPKYKEYINNKCYIFPYEKEIPINNQYRKKVLVNQVENFSLVNNNENIIYFIAVVILVLIYFYKTTK